MSALEGTPPPVLELRGERTTARQLLSRLWQRRDLLPMLAHQHFRGQFRAAQLGVAWSAIQPLVRGAVLAVVFTLLIRVESDVPYPVFVLTGSATWAFLSRSVVQGTTSIAGNSEISGRVYFPRLLLPSMPAAAAFPSYLITLGVVLLLTLGFAAATPGFAVRPLYLLALPAALALGFGLVVTMSAVLALLHVYFRDVGPMIKAGIRILFYATPILYPLERAGEWRWVLELNPMTGAVAVVQWSLFGGWPVGASLWWTIGWTVLLGVVAVRAFQRYERVCVDRL